MLKISYACWVFVLTDTFHICAFQVTNFWKHAADFAKCSTYMCWTKAYEVARWTIESAIKRGDVGEGVLDNALNLIFVVFFTESFKIHNIIYN